MMQGTSEREHEYSELIAEALDLPLYIFNADDHTIAMANAAAGLGDYPKDIPCYKIFFGKDHPCRPKSDCPVESVRKSGKSCILNHVHRDKRGNLVRHREIHAHPIFDGNGKLHQVITSVIDLTERKRLEKALLESEKRFRILGQILPIGICTVDLKGKMLDTNPAVTRLTGFTESELSTMHLRKLFESKEKHDSIWKKMKLKHGFTHSAEVALIGKDGASFFASMTLTVFTTDGRQNVLVSISDISELKITQAKLSKTIDILRKQESALSQKNLALTELVDQIEIEKNLLKYEIGANIREVVYPTLEKMRLEQVPSEYIDMLVQSIRGIADKFGIRVEHMAPILSPREIEITKMIHSGLTSKEIARLLNISYQTVEKHRRNIRKKVGISGKKINLASYLEADFLES